MTEYYEPELGELCFGAAWGIYDLDDPWVDEELCELTELIIKDKYERVFAQTITLEQALWGVGYGEEFKNDIFEIHPYYWGQCTCGYDEKEKQWCEEHEHAENCYQNLVNEELRKVGWKEDKWRYFDAPKHLSYREKTSIEDEIKKKYCEKFGLSFPKGSAGHCTCNYEKQWLEFTSKNDHNLDCPLVRPNFKHFTSGIEIRWYKYIGRGMNVNRADIVRNKWREVFQECRESLGKN